MAPATRPNQIIDWKKQFIDAAPTLFESAYKVAPASAEPDVALRYEQIGRLQMEPTFFGKQGRLKVTPMSLSQPRALVDLAAPGSLRQQGQWVGLHRSAYYYQPVAVDAKVWTDIHQKKLISLISLFYKLSN